MKRTTSYEAINISMRNEGKERMGADSQCDAVGGGLKQLTQTQMVVLLLSS